MTPLHFVYISFIVLLIPFSCEFSAYRIQIYGNLPQHIIWQGEEIRV